MTHSKPPPLRLHYSGAYEAKTKFSELIARAEKGRAFVVTRNTAGGRITPIEVSL